MTDHESEGATQAALTQEREYEVEVVRTSYSRARIRVTASSPEEAKTKAEDEAGSHEFPGAYDAEYEAQDVTEV